MKPEEADSFRYYDGEKQVFADPLATFRKIMVYTRGNPDALIARVFAVKPDDPNPDPEKLEDSYNASDEVVRVVREVFQMKDFDPSTGKGAQDELCWDVWYQFTDFLDDAKKKREAMQTSTPPSDSPPTSDQAISSGSASS